MLHRIMAKNAAEKKIAEVEIRERFSLLKDRLNERSLRLFVASEALIFGWGGISAVVRATGMSPITVRKGMDESKALESGTLDPLPVSRIRRCGGGRKKLTDKYPDLLPALKVLVESTTRGDPESPLLWTSRSLRNIAKELVEQGHKITKGTVQKLLKDLGYSLQANKKCLEGSQHPDRNAQFEHINELTRRRMEAKEPTISVDAKKKELIGKFKNSGRELRPKYDPELVKSHDFPDKKLGKATPYGVYDLGKNEAWVSVGISHDTAEFSVHTIRTWWYKMGKKLYPDAPSLWIIADCGGSNGYRLRLWKYELQKLTDELGFPIHVSHLPPGTSKWNKIEHQLFSFISKNWRGKSLITHHVIVNLIAATTTQTGLRVESHLDENHYPKGRRISDTQMAEICLFPESFHPEWNYMICPQKLEHLYIS